MVGARIELTVAPEEKAMQRRVTHSNLDSLIFETNAIMRREVGSKIGTTWFLPDPGLCGKQMEDQEARPGGLSFSPVVCFYLSRSQASALLLVFSGLGLVYLLHLCVFP